MKTLAPLVLFFWYSTAVAENLPMPPVFSSEGTPKDVLVNYPLGVITELAAYSHHGHPDHKITLPNGLQAWIYEVPADRGIRTYTEPSGVERTVLEANRGSLHWAYTLVFGDAGKVNDVLYDSKHPKDGLSALQIQRQLDLSGQKLPSVSHGAHFPVGGGQSRY